MPEEHPIKRQATLTQADLEALAVMLNCTKCAFTHDESDALRLLGNRDIADTLKSIASNTNKATNLATKTIITGMVLATLSLTWFALKHVVMEFLKVGAIK